MQERDQRFQGIIRPITSARLEIRHALRNTCQDFLTLFIYESFWFQHKFSPMPLNFEIFPTPKPKLLIEFSRYDNLLTCSSGCRVLEIHTTYAIKPFLVRQYLDGIDTRPKLGYKELALSVVSVNPVRPKWPRRKSKRSSRFLSCFLSWSCRYRRLPRSSTGTPTTAGAGRSTHARR